MNFKQAEKTFSQLKSRFEAGSLAESEFRQQLEQLMIQDEQGFWWIIGYKTGLWYRHDGMNWVQTDLPASLPQKTRITPTWNAAIWITLGWAIAGAISWDFVGETGWKVSWVVGGAIGGLLTAATLRMENVLSEWKSQLWITLAWAVGSAIGWGIGGAAGGLLTAATLYIENVLSERKSLLGIMLAWAIGGIVGGIASNPIGAIVGLELGWAISAAISGAIGGSVMIWLIRKGKLQALPA